MTNGTAAKEDALPSEHDRAPASLVDALLVYAESLASGAHALVIGEADSSITDRLLELGAQRVLVFDPDPVRAANAAGIAARGVTVRALVDALDAPEGAFDLAVVPDLAALDNPGKILSHLRSAVGESGIVIAMGRARLEEGTEGEMPFGGALGPAAFAYTELYELFASEFDDVSLVGVVPFQGVVFAQLGIEDEAPPVSVDTRLAPAPQPSVFVAVASSGAQRIPAPLDPYAIVQVPDAELARVDESPEFEAAFATLEERLLEAERGIFERDDRIFALSAELDRHRSARVATVAAETVEIAEISELVARAERAEAALGLHVADVAHLAEAHGAETAAYEEQLRDRARVIARLEKELARREQLVQELVASLEESRAAVVNGGLDFEAAAPLSMTASGPEAGVTDEIACLHQKLDELAAELARRDGELTARAWRITELENDVARLERSDEASTPGLEAQDVDDSEAQNSGIDLGVELARARDELDALRQALAQEHAARVAAESGEELARARAALAQQAVLLEQMRGCSKTA